MCDFNACPGTAGCLGFACAVDSSDSDTKHKTLYLCRAPRACVYLDVLWIVWPTCRAHTRHHENPVAVAHARNRFGRLLCTCAHVRREHVYWSVRRAVMLCLFWVNMMFALGGSGGRHATAAAAAVCALHSRACVISSECKRTFVCVICSPARREVIWASARIFLNVHMHIAFPSF